MTQLLGHREERLHRALAEWIATPDNYRTHKTLEELAEALGLDDAAELYALGAGDPLWNQMALQAAAGLVMTELPSVLATLTLAARKGSTRAAEVLLDWLRKTVQSHPENVPQLAGGGSSVSNTLVLLAQGAGDLAGLMNALGSVPEDAQERMKDWRSQQAVDARNRAAILLDQVNPMLPAPPASLDSEYDHPESVDSQSMFHVEQPVQLTAPEASTADVESDS